MNGRDHQGATFWWDRRLFLLALVVMAAVPLIYPPVPPLVDLLGHVGRYRVELGLSQSPWLQQYYGFRWAAIGNLGVDALIKVIAPLIGLEPAVKLIVLAIPPMTVAGMLWVAREVHGRVPPTALFALPFAYGLPFLYGFVNYTLAMALALLAFAFWLRLGRLNQTRLRSILFVPISVIVFFCHTYGWGALGLFCFSAEAVRQHDKGISWWRAGINAAGHASVMALPLVIMLAWRSETHGGSTHGWFGWSSKWEWIYSALRDRWKILDVASIVFVAVVALFAVASRALTFSRNLAFTATVLFAAFIIIPWTVFGSAFADMRIAPYMIAVALLAIRFRDRISPRLGAALAVLGLSFYAVRLGAVALSLKIAADDQRSKLGAIAQLPVGARVVTMVGYPCRKSWPLPRNTHIGGMVIVRRDGFSNEQWTIEGANLLTLRYREAGVFSADPSQMVRPNRCAIPNASTIDRALTILDYKRAQFDYLWMIDVPPWDRRLTAGMTPVWRGPGSILYRLQQ